MKFEQALKAMRDGKKVTLPGYRCSFFIVDEENYLLKGYYTPDMKYPEYEDIEMLGCRAIMSNDWEIVKEQSDE